MSPIAKAEQLFQSAYPDVLFVQQLGLYLKHGYVLNTPTMFVMFGPVNSKAEIEKVVDVGFRFNNCDSWYIDMAVGALKDLVCHVPYFLPKMCFARKFKEKLKFYDARRFMEKCLA